MKLLLEFPDACLHGVDEESILGDDEVLWHGVDEESTLGDDEVRSRQA